MAIGPGKYDEILSTALQTADAQQGCLIIFDAERGFSVQADIPHMLALPNMLENLAMSIRMDMENLMTQVNKEK